MQRRVRFRTPDIAMADVAPAPEVLSAEEESEFQQHQRRLQLINFGHSQWGFNNWNWSVTKQDLDYIEHGSGHFTAAVISYVSVNIKTFENFRETIGYAMCSAPTRGLAIYLARQWSISNGLYETMLSFGDSVADDLFANIEPNKIDMSKPMASPPQDMNDNININIPQVAPERNTCMRHRRNGCVDLPCVTPFLPSFAPPSRSANIAAAAAAAAAAMNPTVPTVPRSANSMRNNSYVFMNNAPMYQSPSRVYYDYVPYYVEGYDRMLNFPSRNLSGRFECRVPQQMAQQPQPNPQECWMKKWIAEQVEKQIPEELKVPPGPQPPQPPPDNSANPNPPQ